MGSGLRLSHSVSIKINWKQVFAQDIQQKGMQLRYTYVHIFYRFSMIYIRGPD